MLVIGLFAGLLIAVAAWHDTQRKPADAIAEHFLGERWFSIALPDVPLGESIRDGESAPATSVGYMYTRGIRSSNGALQFETTTHFLLEGGQPNTITKLLTFSAGADQHLLQATYSNRTPQGIDTVQASYNGQAYDLEVSRSGSITRSQADWDYALDDFLAFETWLQEASPSAYQSHIVRNIDFERLRVTVHTYEVVEENTTGYLVKTRAPIAATETQLDGRFQPVSLNMAGLFVISQSTPEEAQRITGTRSRANYLFPATPPIERPSATTAIKLRITQTDHRALPSQLTSTVHTAEPTDYIAEEVRFPLSDDRIQRMAADIRNRYPDSIKDGLVAEVGNALSYREHRPAGAVVRALERGYGECTDFADLVTTVARAMAIPARTVYGLVYKEDRGGAFMFHAWNAVYLDGKWEYLDATWNQVRADATHIELDSNTAARLMMAHNRTPVAFEVIEAEY